MATGTNNVIKYADLVAHAVDKIKGICHNIDNFSASVPAQYKNTANITLASIAKAQTGHNGGIGHGYNAWVVAHNFVTKAVTSDADLVTVSSATVTNEINSFMASRGLSAKSNTVMSFKAIINFFNNLASFISAKTFYVYSPINGTRGIVFYNRNSVSYPAVSMPVHVPEYTGKKVTYYKPTEPFNQSNPTYTVTTVDEVTAPRDGDLNGTTAQLQTSVTEFMNSICNVTNVHQALITLSCTCSSCSSSSSSSSSSCSSSSSSFIAYMDI